MEQVRAYLYLGATLLRTFTGPATDTALTHEVVWAAVHQFREEVRGLEPLAL